MTVQDLKPAVSAANDQAQPTTSAWHKMIDSRKQNDERRQPWKDMFAGKESVNARFDKKPDEAIYDENAAMENGS
ncbi:hypothetical protein V492_06686 [Pseudogymnoascus sp. VKM F-4246]|nr:hypothetical protein V492_06686 [Pseudogymnoascus sp. VKM F-4246]